MRRPAPIRVLIADDHPIVREGLHTLISRRSDMEVVAEAGNGTEAVERALAQRPDVALIDLRMPEMDGVEVIGTLRERLPATRAVVLTTFSGDEDVYRALRAGARAYLLKDASRDELLACIRAVHDGRSWLSERATATLTTRLGARELDLTPRERDVLRLVVDGKSNKEIGSLLRLAEGTVKAHVNRIFRKLGVASRAEAVTAAVRRGIIHLE